MKTTTSCGFVLSALLAAGCTNGSGPTLARPNTQSMKAQSQQALGGNGLSASAQFNAPVVDANGSAPLSTGTGSFTVAPATTGGNESLGVVDASGSPTFRYVMVGDFSGAPTQFFAVVTDVPFVVGTQQIDNVHLFAGLFDAQTGDPTHLATSGSVTFSQVGGVGGRWVGSFTGTVEAVQGPPACQSTADCASGEVCSNGVCVRAPPPQCTSNAQCAAGQVCQAGVCVTSPPPQCAADSDCAAGEVCSRGTCVTVTPPQCAADSDCAAGEVCSRGTCVAVTPPQCTSNAQCAAGQVCQSGACVTPPPVCAADSDCARGEVCLRGACVPANPPQCTSNAQCPVGWLCQAGQCTPGGSSGQCEGQQGDGSLNGQVGTVASCAAIPSGAVSISQGIAAIDDERRLIIFDPNAGDEGALLELAVCPGAAGTLTLGSGLIAAAHIKDVQTPTLRLYAERKASSASLTLTRVSPTLAGSFSLSLAAGGTVSGSFTMY